MNMKNEIKYLTKLASAVVVILFSILSYFNEQYYTKEYWEILKDSLAYTIIIMGIYEKYIWKYDPFIKLPKLKENYSGVISYNYENERKEKDIKINIKQSFFLIYINVQTDEMHSATITSDIIEENGQYVLYYTYITNPDSKYSDINPSQRGTCRLLIDNVNEIVGTYWTNRKTIGDLRLTPE